ncbi:unnamed protein product [Orchesella dallaii]|uniref:Gustatory receptor n=1 Tax=Orchesella dallaii TaxID=48710 RepID=A0ABP1QFA7_9HEXA
MNIKEKLSVFLVNFNMENPEERKSNRKESFSLDTIDIPTENCDSQDLNAHIAEMDKLVVEDLVNPVIFVMRYFLPFINSVQYNTTSRRFVVVKGTVWRKAFCTLFELLVILRLIFKSIPLITVPSTKDDDGVTMVAKGAYLVFISFYLTIFYLYWMCTGYLCDIFNDALSLSEKLCIKERSPSRINLVKRVTRASWIFVMLYIIFTIVLYGAECFELTESRNLSSHLNNSRYKLDFTEIHLSHDNIFLRMLFSLSSLLNISCWMMTFLHFGILAAFFQQLMLLFYWRIQTLEDLGLYFIIPHEIRTFNKIGQMIDKLNQYYGLVTLLAAAVIVTYITTSLKQAFSDLQNVLQIGTGLHLMLSYIPMIASAVIIADISRVAGSFAGIIKDEYGKFTKECGDAAESLCGIAIVHYDLTTSNIGFKGLGFFTVSYQFIATILSVIVSYSILIVQLFPHDDSQANDLTN